MIRQFKINWVLDNFGFDYLLEEQDYDELMTPDSTKDYSIVKKSVEILKKKNEVT